MISFSSKTVFDLCIGLHIYVTVVYLFEGVHVEYKWLYSKCNLTDINTTKSTKSGLSLGTCAALCTHTSGCKGFVRRQDDCYMFESCPDHCSAMNEQGTGWNVYCPDGKIHTDVFFF